MFKNDKLKVFFTFVLVAYSIASSIFIWGVLSDRIPKYKYNNFSSDDCLIYFAGLFDFVSHEKLLPRERDANNWGLTYDKLTNHDKFYMSFRRASIKQSIQQHEYFQCISYTAPQLYSAIQGNIAFFKNSVENKIIEVTGGVSTVNQIDDKVASVSLAVHRSTIDVDFLINVVDLDNLRDVQRGDSVTLYCTNNFNVRSKWDFTFHNCYTLDGFTDRLVMYEIEKFTKELFSVGTISLEGKDSEHYALFIATLVTPDNSPLFLDGTPQELKEKIFFEQLAKIVNKTPDNKAADSKKTRIGRLLAIKQRLTHEQEKRK